MHDDMHKMHWTDEIEHIHESEGEQCQRSDVKAVVPPPLESEQCHRVDGKAVMPPPTLMTG